MQSHQITVRLHAPLSGARLMDPAAELPPLPAPSPPPPPVGEPAPIEPQPVQPVDVQEDKPETEPQPDPWETEVGRRLLEERAMIERTLAAMTNAVRQHHEQRSLERAEWRRTAVELAVTLATRLVHDQILSGDYPVETILREMIGQVDGGPVKVHLHPQDLSLLRQRLQGRPLIEGMEGLGIEPDPELARGDCRVEVNDNIVLSQLENQLTEMRGRLLRSLGNAQV